jgi:hypothetical protein
MLCDIVLHKAQADLTGGGGGQWAGRDGAGGRQCGRSTERRHNNLSQSQPSTFCNLMAVVIRIVISPASIFWTVRMFKSANSAKRC